MSDYDKTKRKILPNGKTQYTVGGSRHDGRKRDDIVSRAGVISPGDIMAVLADEIPPEISRKNKKQLDKMGYFDRQKLKDEGLKFIYDDEIEDTPYVYYGNKRYPKTSKLFPGDVIEVIKPNEPKKHKELAQVKHVRNFNDYTISAIYFSGDFFGTKEILTVDQYKIVRRNDGTLPNDMKNVRTDIIKEDDDNIDKI